MFDIIGIDKAKLLMGLENEDFQDFEDCLQMECAKEYGALYIITRNINDFKKIKTIKTEFSNNPTISYINQDNQEKQYEFYIMSQKVIIKVTIVILKIISLNP